MFTTSGLAFQEAQDDTVKITISAGKLGGILMIPKDFKKGPVALIIQGSGPTDKDGNSAILGGKNNSLKMISQTLADLGIASLRFDKRGIGLSAASATAEKIFFLTISLTMLRHGSTSSKRQTLQKIHYNWSFSRFTYWHETF